MTSTEGDAVLPSPRRRGRSEFEPRRLRPVAVPSLLLPDLSRAEVRGAFFGEGS